MKRSASLLALVPFLVVTLSSAVLGQECNVEELLAKAEAGVEQLRHSFLFGCNIF